MVSLFNDLGKKISQTSQEAVKKAKEIAEIAKLNGSISDEERNINKYFSQMGEKYLELYGDTTEEPFASYCESIRASKLKIHNYQQDIKVLRNIRLCTNCGAEYSSNANFCSSCGHKQEVSDVEKVTEPVEIINDRFEVMNDPENVVEDNIDDPQHIDDIIDDSQNQADNIMDETQKESQDQHDEIIDEQIEGSEI